MNDYCLLHGVLRWTRDLAVVAAVIAAGGVAAGGEFRAGAAAVDVSPRVLPAIRNGGFIEATSTRVDDPLHARCLVLADGQTMLAIAIVDSCMVPRDGCDEIKRRVEEQTKRGAEPRPALPASRILIAATHTHSAPSLMDHCLGSRQDPAYVDFFIPRVVEGIVQAHAALAPARAGWTVVSAPEHTHSRRWIVKSDHFFADPFGDKTVRGMMHPGYQSPKYLGPSGPVDDSLSLLSIKSRDGKPLAVLANYSMHYFGGPDRGFSADYFGDFARYLEAKLAAGGEAPRPLAIMSQGTSGDLHWMDYSRPQRSGYTRGQYAQELGDIALAALNGIAYRQDVELAMAESRLTLARRLPSPARLAWAEALDARRGDRRPKDQAEVYAEQALWLRDHPSAELVLQAVRVGQLGITAIPNEVFAVTGLKLKQQSPLVPTMNLELANGAEGYIPPPEQHYLGGYTTWPARTAGLETSAEPQIVAAMLDLLEAVSPRKRRPLAGELYNSQQQEALAAARKDDNNRENRGAANAVQPTSP